MCLFIDTDKWQIEIELNLLFANCFALFCFDPRYLHLFLFF